MATIKVNNITFYPIADFHTYFISKCGKIYRSSSHKHPDGKIQKSHINNDGYHMVWISKDCKQITKSLHRLLALTFIPNPKNKSCVDHKNHIRTDNRLENLRWATKKENSYNISNNPKHKNYWQGVNYTEKRNQIRANWADKNKKRGGASFSVNKYGMMALVCAINKRDEMVKMLYNRPEEIYVF